PYIKMSGHMMVIFFFQAEDGIRDRNVTGVQTCALPISDKPEKTEISAARTAPADDNRPETTTSQKNVPPYAQLRVPARQAQVGIDSCSVTATDGCAKESADLVRAAEAIAELAAERGEVAVENQAQDIIDAKKTWGMNGCSQGYTPDIDVSSDGEILGAST